MTPIVGSIVALVTPMQEDGSVDFDALRAQEANHRLSRGQPDRCHGASPLQTNVHCLRRPGALR